MSEENVELVRIGIAAWNRHDWDAVLQLVDEEVEWRLSGALPDVDQAYHGHDEVLAFWQSWTSSWSDIRAEPEE